MNPKIPVGPAQKLADAINARQKLGMDVITRALSGQPPTEADEKERERLDAEGKEAISGVLAALGFEVDE